MDRRPEERLNELSVLGLLLDMLSCDCDCVVCSEMGTKFLSKILLYVLRAKVAVYPAAVTAACISSPALQAASPIAKAAATGLAPRCAPPRSASLLGCGGRSVCYILYPGGNPSGNSRNLGIGYESL